MTADQLHQDLSNLWARIEADAQTLPATRPQLSAAAPSFPHRLDPDQAQAAAHFTGPVRVLAPAGSGKTRTLTARIASLVLRGVPPENILALAFNSKAADEMGQRLAALSVEGVQTRTFHSLGYEIVREAFGWRYDAQNEAVLASKAEAALQASLPLPEHAGHARRMIAQGLTALREAKSALRTFPEMVLQTDDGVHPLDALFIDLLAVQQASRLITYADMIYFALRALIEHDELRRKRQTQFTFILVDEFQDLNPAQMFFLRLLALPQNNLFVVGDDDQLIYAWRGAEIDHILNFNDMYPAAGSIILETNYRSGSRLIRHGRWLIERNSGRVEKDIRPANGAPAGRLDIVLDSTLEGQAAAAVAWVRAVRKAEGLDWSAFGLLFRVNKDAGALEAVLEIEGIPFTPAGETEPDIGDPPAEETKGKVTLLTIHKAKGKEFSYVVFFNLSRRGGTALTEADERRVAYVGVTRAKDGLLVTADSNRPSGFVFETALNPAFADFAEPFLRRRLGAVHRRERLRKKDLRGWLNGFRRLPPLQDLRVPQAGETAAEIELLATELHFRQLLGVTVKP